LPHGESYTVDNVATEVIKGLNTINEMLLHARGPFKTIIGIILILTSKWRINYLLHEALTSAILTDVTKYFIFT